MIKDDLRMTTGCILKVEWIELDTEVISTCLFILHSSFTPHLIPRHKHGVQAQLAQGSESVVDSHNDNIIIYEELRPMHVTFYIYYICKISSFVIVFTLSSRKSSTMEPDENWEQVIRVSVYYLPIRIFKHNFDVLLLV